VWQSIANYSCSDPNVAPFTPCTTANNGGWRYLMYTMGAMIFTMSLARVTVIRLKETPKFLLGQGDDAKVVENFQELASKYDRPCSLTVEQLEACGTISSAHSTSRFSFGEFWIHIRSLFMTKELAFSTLLIWLSWAMIGLAYPLFNVFLPSYLASRGIEFGIKSTYETWRNYALVQVCGIFGPMLGGHMANWRILGRRYTMIIGALITSKYFIISNLLSCHPR
jgi:hypothetical protein